MNMQERVKVLLYLKRDVSIIDLKLLSVTPTTFTFKTIVSKGCYIRSMIEDMGKDFRCTSYHGITKEN